MKGAHSVHPNENDRCGHGKAEDGLHPAANLETVALVGFGNKIIPTPAEAVAAEQRHNQRAERQYIVGHNEVPKVQPSATLSKGLEGQHAVAQSGSECQREHHQATDQTALGTVPAGQLTHLLFLLTWSRGTLC